MEADLDERRPEVLIPEVEVIAADAPIGLAVGNHGTPFDPVFSWCR